MEIVEVPVVEHVSPANEKKQAEANKKRSRADFEEGKQEEEKVAATKPA